MAELDDGRRQMSDALLRAPRRPHRMMSLWLTLQATLPEAPHWHRGATSPVVGVASTSGTDGERLVVLLREPQQVDLERLRRGMDIPFPVDSLVTGPIRAAARPAQGGDSLSGDAQGGDTGTLGCLVHTATGDALVLGCNHTLAAINRALVGSDTVRQPGAGDGGTNPMDTLGMLMDFEPLRLGGYHPNHIDAAVAAPSNAADVVAGIRGIGTIAGVGGPLTYGARVQKVGWQTARTIGTCRQVTNLVLEVGGVDEALFHDQYGIEGDNPSGFAQGGDSGAAVLTYPGNELVGIVIGVTGLRLAIVCPIRPVLDAFKVTVAR